MLLLGWMNEYKKNVRLYFFIKKIKAWWITLIYINSLSEQYTQKFIRIGTSIKKIPIKY